MTVAIYARVSSESQEARGTIGSQLEVLRLKMAELGQHVVHEYIDDGYSGARLDRRNTQAGHEVTLLHGSRQDFLLLRIISPRA